MGEDDGYVLPNSNSKDWSMVVIQDNKDCSIFPPVNHENLQIFSNHHIPQSPKPSPSSSSSSSSECSFSTSDSDTWGLSSSASPFDSKGGDFVRWMSISLEILRSKLFRMVSVFRNRASDGGVIWSIGVPAAAVVMSCWIIMSMRKNKRRNETRLINIIKEKDGKIDQLLHQIAQMNEILIARHKALAAKVVE